MLTWEGTRRKLRDQTRGDNPVECPMDARDDAPTIRRSAPTKRSRHSFSRSAWQGELFSDAYSQLDAAASEPGFWTDPTRPVRPDDRSPFCAAADPADPSAGDFPVDGPKSA